jgi:hypothetical protein
MTTSASPGDADHGTQHDQAPAPPPDFAFPDYTPLPDYVNEQSIEDPEKTREVEDKKITKTRDQ